MEWKQDHETGYLKSQIGEEDRKDTMLLAPVHDGRNRKLQHGVGYPQRVVNQVAFPVHRAAFFPAPSSRLDPKTILFYSSRPGNFNSSYLQVNEPKSSVVLVAEEKLAGIKKTRLKQ